MISTLRKELTGLFANIASHKHVSWSISLRLFSTSREGALATSPAIFDVLLHKHLFSPEVASEVASVLNRVEDSGKCDSILLFLKESGFSNDQLEKIVKYRPRYLSASLEDTIKPKIRVFQDLGFCSDDIANIISKNPAILHLNLNTRVIPSLSVLKGLLGTDHAVVKLLRKSGWFLHCDLERTMVPNIELLKSCGIPMERIIQLLHRGPRCFLLNPEVIRKSIEKAVEMGTNRSSKMFIYALQAICSMSSTTLELKLQALRNFGFAEGDIMKMFVKSPMMFGGSAEKLKRVEEILLTTGKYDMSCIVNNPTSLLCSIEKRYNPRFQILEILERKNLIKSWPKLAAVYQMSDQKFFDKFVGPYLSKVGDLHIARVLPCPRGKMNMKHSLEELKM